MKRKFNFNISQRIAAGYFVIVLIAAIATVGSILTFESNKSKYRQISDVYLPSVSYLKDFKNLINDSKKLTNDWINQPTEEEKEKLKQLHARDYPELKEKIIGLNSQDNKGNNQLEEFCKNFEVIINQQKLIMQIMNSPESYYSDVSVDKALKILDASVLPQIKILTANLENMLAKENQLLRDNESKLKASYDYLTYVMIVLLLFILIVGYVASRKASTTISTPLNQLKNSILSLGKGEIPDVHLIVRSDEIGEMNNAIVSMKDSIRLKTEFAYETGKGNYNKNFDLLSDKDILGLALIEMNENLKKNADEEKNRAWINSGIQQLNEIIRAHEGGNLYAPILSFLVNYLEMTIGGLYIVAQDAKRNNQLQLVSGFGLDKKTLDKKLIQFGEGLVGQAAVEKRTIITNNIPDNFLKIETGFGEAKPKQIIIIPLLFEGDVKGVLEFALFTDFSTLQVEFIEAGSNIIGSAIDLNYRKEKTEKLLKESQELNHRLQEQEEELKVNNEELTEKTRLLQLSEEELKVQQEELMQTNKQLEEKAQLLEEQNEAIKVKNEELEIAREAIRIKAEELELTSKYKSEFLANMSHELRTPLNSILILANLLAENKEKNLSEKQSEYARVINKSGSDLLELINDILDLSKIESRKIELEVSEFPFSELAYDMESLFVEVGNKKKIHFAVNLADDLPPAFVCDKLRMEQVIKNLLSNAFKFTPAEGSISLNIYKAPPTATFKSANLEKSNEVIYFAVKDSGIGIPKDKQALIFEAFQQADGSTSRKYGGTGLGLSISRELSFMLGGEIQIESIPGEGSTFSLILPNHFLTMSDEEKAAADQAHVHRANAPAQKKEEKPKPVLKEEKPSLNGESKKEMLVLIIEDDSMLSKILAQQAKEKGFKAIIAERGDLGLEMAAKHLPDAIMLDISLPVMDGWEVMRKLKENPHLKNIPVHIISGNDNEKLGMQLGAVEFLKKPVSSEQLKKVFDKIKERQENPLQRVLVIEDNEDQNESIVALLENNNLECSSAHSGKEATEFLSEKTFDLIILDLSLPDITGFELLKRIRGNDNWQNIPVIVHTGKSLSVNENKMLSEFSNAVIIKTSNSSERLMDETTLFLKKLEKGKLHASEPASIQSLPQLEELLKGKKVILVDDDMRNIFALSKFLERFDLNIVVANDGKEALQRLEENPDADIVLMDIMMPEMDGYEAMQKIREQKIHKDLPIIALTAKAMKGDREKCIEAGASDYVSKPVDTQKLVSLMRVWLSK